MNFSVIGRKWLSLTGVVFLFFLLGCGGGNPYTQIDTPTRGEIRVAIDDSYRLLMESEIYAFETEYKYARIDTFYTTEVSVFEEFMNDSVPLIIVNRKLTDQESRILESQQIVPKTTLIAFDAVSLILNNDNEHSKITYDQVEGMFSGRITRWNQIDPASRLGDIKVVFDHYKSANPRYFKELFQLDSLPPCCYAVESNQEVIRYVERNPSAIGVISVNWISDRRDSVSNDFLSRIKVAAISNPGNAGPEANYYRPYQAYIADGSYPFRRNVFCINRQTYSGLAYGLSAYIAADKGQLIILHSGLVPATQPIRIVEIKR
ncbi:MAG: substrate-binding domain-containing protein [Bacteroidales bacterium]|nr:substrate-binding domain-containing protein [Bacteroidales bacterium]